MTARIREALELLRAALGTEHEAAAVAYMREQCRQARIRSLSMGGSATNPIGARSGQSCQDNPDGMR